MIRLDVPVIGQKRSQPFFFAGWLERLVRRSLTSVGGSETHRRRERGGQVSAHHRLAPRPRRGEPSHRYTNEAETMSFRFRRFAGRFHDHIIVERRQGARRITPSSANPPHALQPNDPSGASSNFCARDSASTVPKRNSQQQSDFKICVVMKEPARLRLDSVRLEFGGGCNAILQF